MQEIIGVVIFSVIVATALFIGIRKSDKKHGLKRFLSFLGYFIIGVIGIYLCLLSLGGAVWIISEIAIFLREILRWLIEASFYPIKFFLS